MSEFETWLHEIGLGRFAGAFADNEVGLADLPLLTDADLTELGIPLGPRRRLQSALEERRIAQKSETDIVQVNSLPTGEWRQVTVLFVDLSRFTDLSRELDAEELHLILNRYFEVVDGIIQRYGGRIDKHIGDGVMAVFGAPVAHTNDPQRAVLAACDIHEAMKELSTSLGRAMTAHIGIASGQVVASGTGSDVYSEYTVTGETVNLASRLDDLAEPGETLISKAVYEAVSGAFTCAERGELSVKGYSAPVRAWAVKSAGQGDQRRPLTRLFGRQMELRQFRAMLEECSSSGRGCCLLVRGDPGIGKTRLVEEFAADAARQGFGAIRSLVLDFGTTCGNDTIRSLVLDLLELRSASTVKEREAALNRAIERGALSKPGRIFVTELLHLPRPAELATLYDEMGNAARETGSCDALSQLVTARASVEPLLLIVEDIHWADRLTLAHLSQLARAIAEAPVILVMTTRLEGASMQRDWPGAMSGSPLSVMELQPLQARDAFEFVKCHVHADRQQVDAAVTRSGGNPLFLELLMRNMEESSEGRLPETLQGLVLARVDSLPQRDKVALQAGSVAGQRLSLDLLRHVISDPTYDCRVLLEHCLLKPDGDGYLFDHALIRDGVYASLLGDRRRALHLRVADWFANSDAVLRAEHLDRADDPDAAPAYLEAARTEVDRHRAENALGLLRRGLEITTDGGMRFAFLHLEGELLETLSRFEESAAACEAAIAIAPSEADRCRALLSQALAQLRLDRHPQAEALLDDAASIAEALNLKEEQALIHRRKATIEFARGNTHASLIESTAALAMAEECGLTFLKAEALSCMADAEAAAGKSLSARSHYNQCIELCRANGFRRFAIINTKMLGDNAFYRGEMAAARTCFTQVVEDAAELCDVRSETLARGMLIYLDCLAGKADAAIEQAGMVREQILRIDIRRFLMNNHCMAAMAHRIRGDRESALAHLTCAEALAEELGVVWAMPWVLGERALALGPGADCNESLDRGMALLAAGHGGYYTFEFYRPAIEAAIESADWPRVEKLCADFTRTMGNEPMGLPEYVIDRARGLMASMQGKADTSVLRRLRKQASDMGILVDIPAIDAALAS